MKHTGGVSPVRPETMVIVRYANGQCAGASARDGIKAEPIAAGSRKWDWRKDRRHPNDWDITDYWLAEDVPAERLAA